jgi:crotonobetainyl-CoA:carnitine CoA-transferase CaiB-like acyl-CoA transferase
MTLALEGIGILDMGTPLPGKYCTFLLADLGAEVIRVERPLPPSYRQPASPSAEDLMLNRNKKSITLNLRTEEARRVFYQLVDNTDVVLEGNRPGAAKRIGVDYDTLSGINPGIIYCALSGFGQDGPYHQLPGFDIVFMAIGGLLGLLGEDKGRPIMPGLYISDIGSAAMYATIGILTALVAREKTGRGQFIDVSMLDGVVSWLAGIRPEYFVGSQSPQVTSPGYNIYQTKEGKYIALGIGRPQSWTTLCQILDREDLVAQATAEKRKEATSFLKQTFLSKTREEWLTLLKDSDVEIGPVNNLDEVFTDPQVLHRKMILEVNHPTAGKIRQIGMPIRFSETPGQIRTPAPFIGQHTEEILQGLGYTREQIEELGKGQVI